MKILSGSHRFESVDKCIYCNSTLDLSDEHILALALGGRWVLPKSSCGDCAKQTSRDEALVLRGGLWAVRDFLQLPTRSKSKKTTFRLHAVNGDEEQKIDVAREHYPILLALPQYAGPHMFNLPDCPRLVRAPWYRFLRVNPALLEERYGATEYAPSSMDAHAFARVLFKIAHGLAVATYGLEGFQSYLPQFILGQREDYLTLLGSTDEIESSDTDHELKMADYGSYPRTWVVAHLNLFRRFGAPGYRIIVGRVADADPVGLPPVRYDKESPMYASHYRMLIRFGETQEPGWAPLAS